MKNILKKPDRLKLSLAGWLAALCLTCFISSGALAQNSDLLALQKQSDNSWITFQNDTGAFSIKLPTQPFVIKKELPGKIGEDSVRFLLNLYASVDSASETSYLVRYNDYPAGTFLSDESKLIESFEKDFAAKGVLVEDPKKITAVGLEGWELKITYNQGFKGIIRVYPRGNRLYVLLKQVHAFGNDEKKPDLFFDSFHLLPFTEPAYYTFQPENRNFSIQLPVKPLVKTDSTLQYSSYLVGSQISFSTNPNSGDLFSLETERISPYYRAGNVDSVFKKAIELLNGYKDSLVKLDTINLRGIKGRELFTVGRFSKIKKRSRIFIDGENLFFLIGRTDESELFGKTANVFFNSLTLTRPSRSFDFSSSKAEKICNDLSSTDTLVANRAKGAISYYDFKPDELPLVYAALGKTFPDDTSEYGTRESLIKKLRGEGNDSTLRFLVSLYPGAAGNEEIKAAILNVLPSLKPKTSYNEYLRLLTTDPPLKAKNPYTVTWGLSDSIKFTQQNFRAIIPLIKSDNFRPDLLLIAARVAEVDSPAYKKTVASNYDALMAYASADIKAYLKITDSATNEFSGSVYNYMRLMAEIKNVDLTKRLTDEYLQGAPKGLYAADAIVARIANGLPNDERLLKRYMDSLDTRFDLMKAYYKQKQADKVPQLYRRQDQHAKLCLYKYIAADDEDGGTATDMKLLGTITHGGNLYYTFRFSVASDEKNKVMIGIAGPYKPGSTKLNFDKYFAYTAFELVKQDWRTQASAMIKPLSEAYK